MYEHFEPSHDLPLIVPAITSPVGRSVIRKDSCTAYDLALKKHILEIVHPAHKPPQTISEQNNLAAGKATTVEKSGAAAEQFASKSRGCTGAKKGPVRRHGSRKEQDLSCLTLPSV